MYTQDLRRAPEHVVRQNVQQMPDQTLNKAISGYGGPKINHHQESILQEELDRRWADRQYAAQLADEAKQHELGIDRFDPDQSIDTLQDAGFGPLPPVQDQIDTPNNDIPVQDPVESPEFSAETRQYDNSTSPEINLESDQLTSEQKEALLFIGAIILEAVLIKRTEDTIQAHINRSDELYIADPSIPEMITEYLWKECESNEREDYVRKILGNDSESAIAVVEELSNKVL